MKDTKHTPGPWKLYSSESLQVVSEVYGNVATAGYNVTGGKSIDQAQANAKLIAAAPELLEALKEIEIIAEGGLYTPRECMNRIHELAKLATDKAKGL